MTYYPLTFYQQICKNCWQVNARGKTSKMAKHINLFWMRLYGILCGFVSLFAFSGGRAKAATLGSCVTTSDQSNELYTRFGLCTRMSLSSKPSASETPLSVVQAKYPNNSGNYYCKTTRSLISSKYIYYCINFNELEPHFDKSAGYVIDFYNYGNTDIMYKLSGCAASNWGFTGGYKINDIITQSQLNSISCQGCPEPDTITPGNSAWAPVMAPDLNLQKCYLHQTSKTPSSQWYNASYSDNTGTFEYNAHCNADNSYIST